jgi:hypothetical protein
MVKLKRKINLTKVKKKKFKKWELNWKNNISQIEIEWWNWKQIKALQNGQEQKFKIKTLRAKIEILITKRITLILNNQLDFRWKEREKIEEKSSAINKLLCRHTRKKTQQRFPMIWKGILVASTTKRSHECISYTLVCTTIFLFK